MFLFVHNILDDDYNDNDNDTYRNSRNVSITQIYHCPTSPPLCLFPFFHAKNKKQKSVSDEVNIILTLSGSHVAQALIQRGREVNFFGNAFLFLLEINAVRFIPDPKSHHFTICASKAKTTVESYECFSSLLLRKHHGMLTLRFTSLLILHINKVDPIKWINDRHPMNPRQKCWHNSNGFFGNVEKFVFFLLRDFLKNMHEMAWMFVNLST